MSQDLKDKQQEDPNKKAGAFDWNEEEEFDSDDEDETFGLPEEQPK